MPSLASPRRSRTAIALATLCVGAAVLLGSAACKSDVRPGVRRTAGGDFIYIYNAAPEDVRAAAAAVLQEVGFMMFQDDALPGEGRYLVVGRNQQDLRVIVELSPSGMGATRSAIKIHPGWNEGLALSVQQKIGAKLKQ